jgi:hypothetical protein
MKKVIYTKTFVLYKICIYVCCNAHPCPLVIVTKHPNTSISGSSYVTLGV